jgi:hypothetical protein
VSGVYVEFNYLDTTMPTNDPITPPSSVPPVADGSAVTPLTLEEGREFLDLMARGVAAVAQAREESPAQRTFIHQVSWRGAELAAAILAVNGYDEPAAKLIGDHVQQLQLADTYLYPGLELLERPATARPTELRELLVRHAAKAATTASQLLAADRSHRQAAQAVLDILRGIVEANPGGVQLNAAATSELRLLTDAFDVLYPAGL